MLQPYSPDILPNWVKDDRNQKVRLEQEIADLREQYEAFHFYVDNDEDNGALYAHGILFTFNKNVYRTRLYFPEIYPECQPLPIIMDSDVIWDYLEHSHDFPSNFGIQKEGVAICITEIGEKWDPNKLLSFTLTATTIWLHRYEVWKANSQSRR